MYAPLKVTTDYTILKSLIKIDDLMLFLKKEGISCCAICDENLFGAIDFYNKCLANNIKPIIGLHVTLNELPVYLYAKTYEGYKNLLQIHKNKQQEELSAAILQKYSKDIAVILPYQSNELYNALLFIEDLYIGYMNASEKKSARIITDNTIFINDIRALKVDDLKYLEYLDQMAKSKIEDYSYNYYLRTNDIDITEIEKFTSLINLVMPKNERYIPKYNHLDNSYQHLYNLAFKGLTKRLNGVMKEEYKKRLLYELEVIRKMGYVDYFLIVYDYCLFAKKNNIFVGPGRGSAAGSLVSYSIGITSIDPLKYDLLFERFLNPERVTMPDIDIDFDATKREDVINYVKEKYGARNVALGLTFTTLKSKLVIREVGKILNIDMKLLEKFAKELDGALTLKANLEKPNIKQYLKNYKALENLYRISLKLEGLKRNISTHASGVVISSVPLDEVIPIYINGSMVLTGFPMEFLENLGLLKMDFLGVKNLTTIASVLKKIGKTSLDGISLEDKNVFKLFESGKTDGIFQFETPGMKALGMRLCPSSFEDLIAAVALGRPGPKESAPSFIKRKKGEERIEYLHPDLEPILKNTYGILLYQEQIIAILVKLAGYSYAEADLLRRAISKKKEEIINSSRNEFVRRAIAHGYKEEIASAIYAKIAKFASYGFPKAHSVAYAVIVYQMAYLKVYHPMHFITELLNTGSNEKNNIYLSYLKQKGIIFYKPSINNRSADYEFLDQKLVLPLKIIKNINSELANKILANKKNGYTGIYDFVLKNKDYMNTNILSTLIYAGAMDCFKETRKTLINAIDSALNYAELAGDIPELVEKPSLIEYPEYSEEELRKEELDSFGFYINNHPTNKYRNAKTIKLIEKEKFLFKKVEVVCLINKIQKIQTKKGEDMAFFTGSDESGTSDFTVFPKVYRLFESIPAESVVYIQGEVTKRFDKTSIIVNNINKLEG